MQVVKSLAYAVGHKVLELGAMLLIAKLLFSVLITPDRDSVFFRWGSLYYLKDLFILLYIGTGFLVVSFVADVLGAIARFSNFWTAIVSSFPIFLYLLLAWLMLFNYTEFLIFAVVASLLSFALALGLGRKIFPLRH